MKSEVEKFTVEREHLIEKIREFKKRLSGEMDVKEMILFGSRASGGAHRDSDVDLIIASPFFRGKKCAREKGFIGTGALTCQLILYAIPRRNLNRKKMRFH